MYIGFFADDSKQLICTVFMPNHYNKMDRQQINPLLSKGRCDWSFVLGNENLSASLLVCDFATEIWRERNNTDNLRIT